MLSYALILLGLAAVVGLYLAARHLRDNPPSLSPAVLHGVLAVLGLAVVIWAAMGEGDAGYLPIAICLFVVAALGGLVLFALHAKKKPLPKPLIVVHALAAVAGFVLVLLTALG